MQLDDMQNPSSNVLLTRTRPLLIDTRARPKSLYRIPYLLMVVRALLLLNRPWFAACEFRSEEYLDLSHFERRRASTNLMKVRYYLAIR